MRRRHLLSYGITLGHVAVVGCVDGGPGTDADSTPGGAPATTDPGTTGAEATPTSTEGAADELDLREANVTGVEIEPRADDYRFAVTLFHDDDGEDGYANWWQVETLRGDRLGRRDLAHAHGTREFTRSKTVPIPSDIDCVVVRGHDLTHEYGGQAALVDLASGGTRFVSQGREPIAFDGADCP